jgi:hypothetical protein
VLASAILFLEHHDKETVHEDIDWAISMESDLLQFMELGPTPGTRLYHEYEAAGKILTGIPWPKKHGQDEIWFHHPHFTLPESASYLRDAFVKKYHMHGPGVLSMATTAVKGYLRIKSEIEQRENLGLTWDPDSLKYAKGQNPAPDTFMKLRLDSMKRNALRFRPVLSTTLKYAPNAQAAEKCRQTMDLYQEAFGPMTLLDRAKSIAVRLFAIRESQRIRKEGSVLRQPPTNRATYPDRKIKCATERSSLTGATIAKQPEIEVSMQ